MMPTPSLISYSAMIIRRLPVHREVIDCFLLFDLRSRLLNRLSSERHQACLFGRVGIEVGVANVSCFVHKYSYFFANIRYPPK